MRYHDGEPAMVEGLLSRGDRRVGAVIEQVWRDGGRFDGWSEHFSYERWVNAAELAFAGQSVDIAFFTTRERDADEVLPWDHLDSGLDKQWLWDDWQDALTGYEQDNCRWTPCFDCGFCPSLVLNPFWNAEIFKPSAKWLSYCSARFTLRPGRAVEGSISPGSRATASERRPAATDFRRQYCSSRSASASFSAVIFLGGGLAIWFLFLFCFFSAVFDHTTECQSVLDHGYQVLFDLFVC